MSDINFAQAKIEIFGFSGGLRKKASLGVAHDKGFGVDIAFCNSLGLSFVKKYVAEGFGGVQVLWWYLPD
jgi:hypothetical protein